MYRIEEYCSENLIGDFYTGSFSKIRYCANKVYSYGLGFLASFAMSIAFGTTLRAAVGITLTTVFGVLSIAAFIIAIIYFFRIRDIQRELKDRIDTWCVMYVNLFDDIYRNDCQQIGARNAYIDGVVDKLGFPSFYQESPDEGVYYFVFNKYYNVVKLKEIPAYKDLLEGHFNFIIIKTNARGVVNYINMHMDYQEGDWECKFTDFSFRNCRSTKKN